MAVGEKEQNRKNIYINTWGSEEYGNKLPFSVFLISLRQVDYRALGSITMNKASGGDGIPVELFQILKDDAVKVLHSIC